MRPLLREEVKRLLRLVLHRQLTEREFMAQVVRAYASGAFRILKEIKLKPIGQKRREKLIALDGDRCFYCDCRMDTTRKCLKDHPPHEIKRYATVDHVIPSSLGGLSTLENCVLACFNCNTRKQNTGVVPFFLHEKPNPILN
jgi:5-methylcytosine-specific restriction endonuclease McrA